MRALVWVGLLAGYAGCARPSPKGPPVDATVVFAPRDGGDGIDGRVRCEAAGAQGVACAISHEGDRTLTVCFHAELDCANGTHTNAESCRETPPGVEIRTLHAADGCDRPTAGRVTAAWVVAH